MPPANDNARPFPSVGRIGEDGAVTFDAAFERQLLGNDISPRVWKAAIAKVRAEWILPAGAGQRVEEARHR